ncbi:MAG: NTP transferase domain-containing protein [candidate division Zixibacteria bacterium]|nr:NTP transferase domain-containing protein [candidate division Zixibacteria bacterium]
MTTEAAVPTITGTVPPALILAAGEGHRLNGVNGGSPKPLTMVLGLTLLERAILSCKEVGVLEFYVVIGYRANKMIPYLRALEQRLSVLIKPVENPNWRKGNGSSAISAAPYITRPFLLLMCDHLFDPAILRLLLTAGTNTTDCLLAVDSHADRVFDLDDATKVQLDGDVITGIGKERVSFDAVDTGLFLCQHSLFDALEIAQDKGQYSLSAGLVELIRNRGFRAVTIGTRFWFDVDSPKSLGLAKKALLRSLSKPDEDGFVARHLNRPVSRRISEILVRTPINPNGISLLSFAVGIVGAVMFCLGGYIWTILAGLVIQLSSIVDGCDGEVARLKFQSSKFGGWFDTILDRYADTAIVVGVSFGYWLAHPHAAVWLGAIFALTGFIMASYTKKEFVIRYQSNPPGGLFARLIKRDARIFAIMLGAIVNLPYEAMLIAGFLSHIGIGLMLIKGHRRTA